jgi:hypothetical protein
MEDKLYRDYERNKRGIHSEQESMMRFINYEEHNEVLKILRLKLGRKFDKLCRDQSIGTEYIEIFYYVPNDSECVLDECGDCIGHREIKNYLAHGYLPKED